MSRAPHLPMNVSSADGSREVIKRTNVYPHPDDEGTFVLERPTGRSFIQQGTVQAAHASIRYAFEWPEDVIDPIPLLLVPGFGGIKPAYRALRKAVVQNGKPAITFHPPRTQRRFAGLHPAHLFHPEKLLAQSTNAVARDVRDRHGDRRGFDRIDGAGHSMGGPGLMNAAFFHPEFYRVLVAMASAGLDGHNVVDMGRRLPGVVRGDLTIPPHEHVRRNVRTVKNGAHYVLRNPLRTVTEGYAVASGDIRPTVRALGDLGVVQLAALQFPADRFFPLEKVREKSADLFHDFREHPDPNATHEWPQEDPEGVALELLSTVSGLAPSEHMGALASVSVIRRGHILDQSQKAIQV